jgi:hypothetical protein
MGSAPASHGMKLMPITANYGTGIFCGDLVKLSSGFIIKETGTTTALPCGVFIGCEYEDTTLGLFHRAFWPASTAIKSGTTAWAYVIDDPDALFQVQSAGSITTAHLGLNADLIAASDGSTVHGRSILALASTTPTTSSTRPIRIMDFVRKPGSVAGDAKTDVIVRINTHANRTA